MAMLKIYPIYVIEHQELSLATYRSEIDEYAANLQAEAQLTEVLTVRSHSIRSFHFPYCESFTVSLDTLVKSLHRASIVTKTAVPSVGCGCKVTVEP